MTTDESVERDTRVAAPATRLPGPSGTREAIMDAARDLFFIKGVGSTSVRDIAGRADVSLSTIYLHFETKEEIIRAVMVRSHEVARSPVEDVLSSSDEPSLAKLLLGLRVHAMQHMVVAKEAMISSYGMAEVSGGTRQELRALAKSYEHLFQELAHDLAARGEIASANLPVKMRMLLTAGVEVGRWYKPNGSLPPEAIADVYIDLCRDGLGA